MELYKRPIFDPYVEFNPPKTLLLEVIKDLNKQSGLLLQYIREAKKEVWLDWLEEIFEQRHRKLQSRIKTLRYRLGVFEATASYSVDSGSNGAITALDISAAKELPIGNYYNGTLKRAGLHRLKGICPFHSEKTPSFIIYTDQNTFHCYSCNVNGDVIDFVSKLNGLSFIDTVKYLGNR